MAFADKKGIALAGGFKLQAESPLDARQQVDTIADRDELVTIHAAWEGMVVYVKEEKKSYEYQGTDKGWVPNVTGVAYTHPTTPGNKHIPAGGAAGQFLSYQADGTAKWETPTKASVGLGNVDNTADKDKPVSTAQQAALDEKVDKVVGKGLSANDFTDELLTKLNGIEDGANKYTHPASHSLDMITETTTKKIMTNIERDKLAAIEEGANKYIHPDTHAATMITEDETHRFMTDAERTKLQGIAANANKYEHPTTHPATMITQDASHRFATDAEKGVWNAKADIVISDGLPAKAPVGAFILSSKKI